MSQPRTRWVYVGIALGRRVRGGRVMTDELLGKAGIVFRDGHIEINAGVYFDGRFRVVKRLPGQPIDTPVHTNAKGNAAVVVRVTIENNPETKDLELIPVVEIKSVDGDDPFGVIGASLFEGTIGGVIQREIKERFKLLNEQLNVAKLANRPGLVVYVKIEPGKLTLSREPTFREPYYLIMNEKSGKVLDLPLGPPNLTSQLRPMADRVPIQQYKRNDGLNQQWLVSRREDGYCTFSNRLTLKALDIPDGAKRDKLPLQQYRNHGKDNQLWTLEPVAGQPDKYRIRNKMSGLLLDVADASKRDYARVQQYHDNGGANQIWILVPAAP